MARLAVVLRVIRLLTLLALVVLLFLIVIELFTLPVVLSFVGNSKDKTIVVPVNLPTTSPSGCRVFQLSSYSSSISDG